MGKVRNIFRQTIICYTVIIPFLRDRFNLQKEEARSFLHCTHYAPIKVENMILGGGILRSGGRTKIILVIDCLGTWCVGIPLCLLAAYGLRWGIVGVYALLNAEEAFRLVLSLVMFRRRSWMVSLSKKQSVP